MHPVTPKRERRGGCRWSRHVTRDPTTDVMSPGVGAQSMSAPTTQPAFAALERERKGIPR